MVLSSILDHMHPQWIVSYHEHDSLLEHVFDEELSEEERKAAWESYNSQKSAETARYNSTVYVYIHYDHTAKYTCNACIIQGFF